jgi:hypothetical protein
MAILHDFVTLHNCDTTDGITVIGDGAISVNTSLFKEGTGALNIYKPYTTTTSFGIELSFPETNFRDKLLSFWLYVKKDTIPKLDKIRLHFFDSAGNTAYRDITVDILNPDGWKSILYMLPWRWQGGRRLKDPPFLDVTAYSPAYPDVTKIVKIRIEFFTKNATDTIGEGEIVIDWIKLGREIIVLEGIVGNLFTKVAEYDKQNNLGVIEYGDGTIILKGARIVIGDGVASYTCSTYGENIGIITPQESLDYVYVRNIQS